MTLVVIDAVGLTPARAGAHAAALAARRRRLPGPRSTPSCPPSPARVQSTFLTGLTPDRARHRRQRLVLPRPRRGASCGASTTRWSQGEKVWETARRAKPGYRVANVCWWYAMGADDRLHGHAAADLLRRRPQGARLLHRPAASCTTTSPAPLGEFPLFQYWGADGEHQVVASGSPTRRSSVLDHEDARPAARLPAAPRLRPPALRPRAPRGRQAAAASSTSVARRPASTTRAAAATRSSCSPSTASPPRARPVDINRALRRAGLLNVYTQDGHGVPRPVDLARVRRRRPPDRARLRRATRPTSPRVARGARRRCAGVDEVLEGEAQAAAGLDHPRSGELVAVAEPRRLVHLLLLARRRPRARLRAARSRSTASPATTPPSCSWTRTTSCVKAARRLPRSRARRPACATSLTVVPLDPSARARARTGGCRPTRATGRCSCARTRRSPATAIAATEVRDLLLELERRPGRAGGQRLGGTRVNPGAHHPAHQHAIRENVTCLSRKRAECVPIRPQAWRIRPRPVPSAGRRGGDERLQLRQEPRVDRVRQRRLAVERLQPGAFQHLAGLARPTPRRSPDPACRARSRPAAAAARDRARTREPWG